MASDSTSRESQTVLCISEQPDHPASDVLGSLISVFNAYDQMHRELNFTDHWLWSLCEKMTEKICQECFSDKAYNVLMAFRTLLARLNSREGTS
jgi:hypothetical protein